MALKEQIEAVNEDGRALQNNLTNMFNQQKEELEEATKEQTSSFSEDFVKVNEQRLALAKLIAETNEKVEELEQNIPKFSDDFVSKIETKISEFVTNTDKRFETAEETITDTQTKLKHLNEKCDKNSEEISKLSEVTIATNDNLTALEIKSNETWLSVENTIENHSKSVQEIRFLVDLNSKKQEEHEANLLLKLDGNNLKTKEDIDILSSQINKVSDDVEKTKGMTEDNNENLKTLNSKMTKHSDIFDTINIDLESVKDKLRKTVDNIESVNRTTQVIETLLALSSSRLSTETILLLRISCSLTMSPTVERSSLTLPFKFSSIVSRCCVFSKF